MEMQTKKPTAGTRHARTQQKNRKYLILLLVLLLLLAVVAGAMLIAGNRAEPEPTGPVFAANASVGALPIMSEEEIRARLQQEVDDRTVAFTINPNPIFANGTSKGTLMLESPANNINYIEFVIKRDDTGETIYRSGLMKPNQYIEEDQLLVDLDKGKYPCTADITLYDTETFEAKGMCQAALTIHIEN